MNYAKEIPLDKNGNPYSDNVNPAFTSLQSQAGVPIASSVITLTPDTTVLMVNVLAPAGATGTGAIIGKWGSASVTSTNFDWMATPNHQQTLVVPRSTNVGTPSVQGINPANGLYSTVAVKTATAQSASVFTAEY